MSNIYLILLIVVLALNLVFWLSVICCRIIFNYSPDERGAGCLEVMTRRRRRGGTSNRGQGSRSGGHRNLGFNNQEPGDPSPYSITSAMDLPPSYEEAAKHSLYSTEHPLPYLQVVSLQRSSDVAGITTPQQQQVDLVVSDETPSIVENTAITVQPNEVQENSQTFSHQRSSAEPSDQQTFLSSSSETLQPPLSPITEDDEDISLTFVIDNIGVQSARLIGELDPTTKLTDGDELAGYSKC